MVVIEKMQLSKTTTFQLTFSNGAYKKSCVFEMNRTSTFGRKISITTRLKFCIDCLHGNGQRLFERYKFIHLPYIVYKNIQPHVEKRSTYAHFIRLEVEYRLIIEMIMLYTHE